MEILHGKEFRRDAEAMKLLTDESPMLLALLKTLELPASQPIVQFFEDLIKISSEPFKGELAPEHPPTEDPFSYFPSLTPMRRRENFKADSKKVSSSLHQNTVTNKQGWAKPPNSSHPQSAELPTSYVTSFMRATQSWHLALWLPFASTEFAWASRSSKDTRALMFLSPFCKPGFQLVSFWILILLWDCLST